MDQDSKLLNEAYTSILEAQPTQPPNPDTSANAISPAQSYFSRELGTRVYGGKHYHDGDEITIEGKRYVIAKLKGGGFTLLDAGGPGWSPAGFEP